MTKVLHLGKRGYLSLATNFPEIMEEISNTKRLLNSFNKGRRNIWRYRDTILNYNSGIPVFIKVEPSSAQTQNSREKETIIRLSQKSKPYGKSELDEIILRAYNSIHIQKICKAWENDPSVVENISDEVIEVI